MKGEPRELPVAKGQAELAQAPGAKRKLTIQEPTPKTKKNMDFPAESLS